MAFNLKLITKSALAKFIVYLFFYLLIKIFIEHEIHNHWVALLLSLFFIIPEVISDYYPKFLAYLIVNKKVVIAIFFTTCIVFSTISYFLYTYNHLIPTKINYIDLLKNIFVFGLQGAILGLITRMLLIHYYDNAIQAKDVFITKILIMIVYLVLLIIFPFKHKPYISSYLVGFSLGFYIHFLSKTPEKRNARFARLSQNLLSMIGTMKNNDYTLTSLEENAIKLYAGQKWSELKKFLFKVTENEIFFFIRLSMERKLHQYDTALNLLNEKENEIPKCNWFEENKHFFRLHYSLNKYEKTAELANERKTIIDNLSQAISINADCLLSITTLALVIANEIDMFSEEPENEKNKKESLHLIWKAMKIYEKKDNSPQIISLITGLTIPVTYSFLLDTYGYILFKNGYYKFSKALFLQCLHQDPSFSPTYVHLAEWFIAFDKTSNKKNSNLIKAAKLNLNIAIENEKLDDKQNNRSFIFKKANKLLLEL